MNRTLLFFTFQFPYGMGETFIENEIGYLAQEFEEIYIFPIEIQGQLRPVPENCKVIVGLFDDKGYNRSLMFKRYPKELLKLFLSELLNHGKLIDSKNKLFSQCLRMVYKASLLEDWLRKNNIKDGLFYTFWMDSWTTILSILKSKGRINKIVSRANGFDIYEERRENNFIPYRQFQLQMVNKVYCASKASMDYLRSKYPKYSGKIEFAYLGVMDYGLNPWRKSNQYIVVSCSNVITLKRVHLIPEILKNLKLNLRWIHFGDGKQMEELEKQVQLLPENITVELKSRVSNQNILEFYKTNSVDLFIHLSESEGGVPVAIQEAVSFGIPTLATDVGGISEIVNDSTGILVNKEFNSVEVSDYLINSLDSEFSSHQYRNGIREFWKNNFNAEKNYTLFTRKILK